MEFYKGKIKPTLPRDLTVQIPEFLGLSLYFYKDYLLANPQAVPY
jgi:hypothetical protein